MRVGLEGRQADITVDSGAQESVCGKEWGSGFPLVSPPVWRHFKTASGSLMNHYGQRTVQVMPF
jgi:hypothetical protein